MRPVVPEEMASGAADDGERVLGTLELPRNAVQVHMTNCLGTSWYLATRPVNQITERVGSWRDIVEVNEWRK